MDLPSCVASGMRSKPPNVFNDGKLAWASPMKPSLIESGSVQTFNQMIYIFKMILQGFFRDS